MVRITKVYTKTGDKGMTHLAGQKRVPKTSARIDTIGCIDELGTFLGWILPALMEKEEEWEILIRQIRRILNELYDLGAQFAVLAEDRREDTPTIKAEDVTRLEREIDKMNANLPSLRSFVLPGGNEISARFHIARAVCRRTERAALHLAEKETLDGVEVPYLNRLSDWLFVAARLVEKKSAAQEILWQPGKREF